MKKSLILMFLFLNIFIISQVDGANVLCNSCSDCNSKIATADPGDVLVLTTNIDTSDNVCINMSTNHITFFCNGHLTIKGSGTYGFLINRSSQTLVNSSISSCNLNGWDTGVYSKNANEFAVDNVSFTNISNYGVQFNFSINNSVTWSNFTDLTKSVIANNYDNVSITNSSFLGVRGVEFYGGNYPTVDTSNFTAVQQFSAWVKNSSNLTIYNSLFNLSELIVVNTTNDLNITLNTFLGNTTSDSLKIELGTSSSIIQNYFENSQSTGQYLLLQDTAINAFSYNNLVNGLNAISLVNNTHLNFTYNNITNFTGIGVSITLSPSGNFFENNFYNITTGFKMFDNNSGEKAIYNNTFNISTTALLLNSSFNMTIHNNTIDTATTGISLLDAQQHIVNDNTLINVQKNYYKEFNLDNLAIDSNSNITSLLKLYNGIGSVNFLSGINYSRFTDFSSIFSSNLINNSALGGTGPAELNLYNISEVNIGFEVFQNDSWSYCSSDECSLVNYSDDNAFFNVSEFGTYRAVGDSVGISDETDDATQHAGDQVDFSANYTNASKNALSGANISCQIKINLSDGWTDLENMSFEDTLYKFNTSFSNPGEFLWIAICNINGQYVNFSSTVVITPRVTVTVTTTGGSSYSFSFDVESFDSIEDVIRQGEETFIKSESFLEISNEHNLAIFEEIQGTVPEDWKNVLIEEISKEKESSIATVDSLEAVDIYLEEEPAIERIKEIKKKAKKAKITSLETTNSATVYKIVNKDTGETEFRTALTAAFEADEDFNSASIIEIIPKHIAKSASELVFMGEKPTVLQDDPIVEWNVDAIQKGDKKEFTYIVKRKVTKIETITIGTGDYENSMESDNLPCAQVDHGTKETPVTSLKAEVDETQITPGYEVAIPAFNLKCDGQSIDFTVNVPLDYNDVKILKCTDEGCTPTTTETVNELQCGDKIIRETVIEEEFAGFVPINITNVTISYEEFKIAMDNIKLMEFYDDKDITLKETAIQPINPNLKIIGAPLKIRFNNLEKTKVSFPIINPIGFENNSHGIYVNSGNLKWEYIGGEIIDDVIYAEIPQEYIINNEAELAVMALLCLYCIEAKLELAYSPEKPSRDAVVLVHGLASSPATYEEILQDVKLTEQPFHVLTYGYPTSQPIKKNAEKFSQLLDSKLTNYDNVFIVAHSMGGLITQQTLNMSKERNFVKKIKKIVLVGTPNEGVPEVGAYHKFFQFLVNVKTENKLFNLNSGVVDELSKGMITPRLEHIKYFVIAGTEPFRFTRALNINESNDGIVTVPSAQRVGDDYIKDSCKNYWGLKLSHNELIDNVISRRLIERIVAKEIIKNEESLFGNTQFYQFHVENCNPEDKYVVIGVKKNASEIFDPTGCSCGNNVCDIGEDLTNCPSDCAVFTEENKEILNNKTLLYIGIILLLILIGKKKLIRIFRKN